MVRTAHVLCPVDFSEISHHALDHAAAMARWYEAHLTLLYVFATLPTMDLPPPVPDLSGIRESAAADARRKLYQLIPEQARTYCTMDTAIVEGRAIREILRYGTAQQSDLVVMGVHGRGHSICWFSDRPHTT